ncbi:hypothetical protein ACFQ0B_13405 [Nonomuraea thailandensis]
MPGQARTLDLTGPPPTPAASSTSTASRPPAAPSSSPTAPLIDRHRLAVVNARLTTIPPTSPTYEVIVVEPQP